MYLRKLDPRRFVWVKIGDAGHEKDSDWDRWDKITG
jgi:hypothetical protein